MRCRRGWHPGEIYTTHPHLIHVFTFFFFLLGVRCEGEEEVKELEMWRLESGAQRCPTCLKIIEKEDPDTCFHMVHRSTDPIPCDVERTDFCCKMIMRMMRNDSYFGWCCRFVWV